MSVLKHQDVRTTLTLDDDVARKLQAEVRRTGRPFKEVVNEALRTALTAKRAVAARRPFTVRARPLGLRPGLSYDSVEDLLETLDGPGRR
jgi:hypothetical protein